MSIWQTTKSAAIMARAVSRTLAISLPTVAEAIVNRVSRETCDRRLANWSSGMLRDAGVELDISGAERLAALKAEGRAAVVMSNHQSLYDIPVLFQVVPPSLRMVAKKELFRVPVWGAAMKASGFIAIDRARRMQAMRALDDAGEALEQGTWVWVAPEGTRSPDGVLLPFKKGGFVLAERLGLPIVPVSLDGTREILAARTLAFRKGARVRVTVHEPVAAGDGSAPSREAAMLQVRQAIASALSP